MPDRTWSVPDLTAAVDLALSVCFPDEVWVEGELSSLRRSPRRHVYFQLVEPDEPGRPPRGALSVVLFDGARRRVNAQLRAGGAVRMSDGVRVRIRGRLGVYGPAGQLQLRMSAIDPAFTLGRLAADRARILAALAADGLLDRNAALPLPVAPLRVGLITAERSAAEADVLHELERSGLPWQVLFVPTRVQGSGADRLIADALRTLEARRVDIVALVRGGGARTDLATFDSEHLARTVAGLGVPVLTGIGHETDRSIADEVAHQAHKTPTACAAALVSRVVSARDRTEAAWNGIATRATRAVDRQTRAVDHRADRAAAAARWQLRAHDAKLHHRTAELRQATGRATTRADERLATAAIRLHVLDPRRALERGWSITRTADGRVVRDVDEVTPGAVLHTTLATGVLTSRVEEVAGGR
ncbi:MAG: exodeoxyribonuclease VII large subunit [Acidimicrobiales bacterium]|jgi:exodeoxyribonuclease VII large subunit|nr:exodeoxyribonuclease VII large subunit [Acidimicrobiales bacterium]